jgi:hypothetical protein
MTLLRLIERRGVVILILSCLILAAEGLQAAAQNTGESHTSAQTAVPGSSVKGNILQIDGQTLTVAVPEKIKVIGSDAQQKVSTFSTGDTVLFTADKDEAQAASITKDNVTVPVSVQGRLAAGFIALVLVFFVAGLATGRSNNGKLAFGNPLSFCVGVDNRTSNSQTQMVFWSATVLVAYLTTIFLRGWMTGWSLLGGVGIPVNLLAFSGLSALSFGGARAITVSKVNAANADDSAPTADASAQAGAVAKDAQAKAAAATSAVGPAQATSNAAGAAAARAAVEATKTAQMAQAVADQTTAQSANGDADIKAAPAGTAHITQLFQNDMGQADLGDTQMILITLIAIGIYVATSFHQLGNLEIAQQVSLPDIDSYLLASFGIGQGAYLAKKAASNLGSG